MPIVVRVKQADPRNLPSGKTCKDCDSAGPCQKIYQNDMSKTHCDWLPSRFVPATGKPHKPPQWKDLDKA